MNCNIKKATESDLDFVLSLNQSSLSAVSYSNLEQMKYFLDISSYFKILRIENNPVGFLIGLMPGKDYKSENYIWVNRKYKSFIYIDRVCISNEFQRHGLGKYFYDQVKSNFKKITKRMVCEVNIFPRNKKSDLFHMRYGFKEVGKLKSKNSLKIVSLKSYEF